MAEAPSSTPSPAPAEGPRRARWDVRADAAEIAGVRHGIEGFCAACGFDEAGVGEVGLVVNEAMANVIRHAYCGAGDARVRVEAEFAGEELRVTMRDWGCGAVPPTEPRMPDPLALTPGGLGLVCLRAMMDEVRFTPQPDGMLLTMTRKRSRRAAAGAAAAASSAGGDRDDGDGGATLE